MKEALILYGPFILLVALVGLLVWLRRRPRPIRNTAPFKRRWRELQKNCSTRKTWPQALADADKLLDDALKCHHYRGKTTGERLVAAQHDLSSNDMVWFGHKLCEKIAGQDVRTLKKQDILDALNGFRQALKDLGALK